MYVYHATLKQNQSSIEKNGLLLNQAKYNGNNYYVQDQLFFTWLSPKKAYDIVSSLIDEEYLSVSKGDILVYAIDINTFDIEFIGYDYNYDCQDYEDIESFTYKKPISPDRLILLNPRDYENKKYQNDIDLLDSENEFARNVGEKLIDIYEDQIEIGEDY